MVVLKKCIFLCGFVGLMLFNTNTYAKNQPTYVDRHTGSKQIQGLKYVKASAHSLMVSYNKKHKTQWQALEPNAKYVLSRCLVPLKVSWDIYNMPQGKAPYWHIVVKCDHAVTVDHKRETWKAIVQTTRPYIQAKGKVLSSK